MGNKTPKPKRIEVRCINTFKNSSDVGGSINKLWAEVINILENSSNTRYTVDMAGHAQSDSKEFEVSGE